MLMIEPQSHEGCVRFEEIAGQARNDNVKIIKTQA